MHSDVNHAPGSKANRTTGMNGQMSVSPGRQEPAMSAEKPGAALCRHSHTWGVQGALAQPLRLGFQATVPASASQPHGPSAPQARDKGLEGPGSGRHPLPWSPLTGPAPSAGPTPIRENETSLRWALSPSQVLPGVTCTHIMKLGRLSHPCCWSLHEGRSHACSV